MRTGSVLHPFDTKQFHDFIISVHQKGEELDASKLQRWFEDEGWPQDKAYKLAVEYENGLILLTHYDGR